MSCSTKAAVEIQAEQAGHAADRNAEMDDEAAVAEEAAIGPHDRQRRHRLRRALPQRLRQQQPDHAGRHAPKQNSATKFDRQPNSGLQHAADQRRDQRRQRHDRRHARQLARRRGRRRYMSRTTARASTIAPDAPTAWTEARRDQRLDRGRQRAGKRRQEIDAERGEQHRLAAMAVGQRAVEHLRRWRSRTDRTRS